MKQRKSLLFNYNYCIILLCNLAAQFGYSMVNANVASYAKSIGVVGALLGSISGMMSIAGIIACPFSGFISDRFSKKKVFSLMLGCMTMVFLGYALAPNVYVLIFLRILHGIFYSFCSTLNMSMVADTVTGDKLTRGLGYYGLTGTVANAIAPTVGVKLQEVFGFRTMFLCSAGICLLAFCLVYLLHNECKKAVYEEGKRGWNISISNLVSRQAIPATLIAFCNAFAMGAINGLIIVYAAEKGIENASLFFIVFALVTLVSRPVISVYSERVHPKYVVYPCDLFIILTLVVLALAQNTVYILLAGCFFGIGYGGLQPLLQSMALKNVSMTERGVASSTFYIGLNGGNGLGPVLCSAVTAVAGGRYQYGFLSIIFFILIGMVVMHRVENKFS